MVIPLAYGPEIKRAALHKKAILDRQLMAIRQQQINLQQAKAKKFNDGYRY